MPRQAKASEQVRKLGKTGAPESPSYFVTLPKSFVKELGWKDGQRLVVRQMHGQPKLIIEDWKE